MSISASSLALVRSGSADREVFAGIDLVITRGINVLYGPPGSGKTSLLELIAGLEKPSSGTIVNPYSVSMMPQDPGAGLIYPSVMEELGIKDAGEAAALLKELGMGPDFTARSSWTLSPGEKKRLFLARFLLERARGAGDIFYILDAPFDSLDRAGIDLFIEKLFSPGTDLLMSSSSPDDLDILGAAGVEYRRYDIRDGRVDVQAF